jgi:hypothetical protein
VTEGLLHSANASVTKENADGTVAIVKFLAELV